MSALSRRLTKNVFVFALIVAVFGLFQPQLVRAVDSSRKTESLVLAANLVSSGGYSKTDIQNVVNQMAAHLKSGTMDTKSQAGKDFMKSYTALSNYIVVEKSLSACQNTDRQLPDRFLGAALKLVNENESFEIGGSSPTSMECASPYAKQPIDYQTRNLLLGSQSSLADYVGTSGGAFYVNQKHLEAVFKKGTEGYKQAVATKELEKQVYYESVKNAYLTSIDLQHRYAADPKSPFDAEKVLAATSESICKAPCDARFKSELIQMGRNYFKNHPERVSYSNASAKICSLLKPYQEQERRQLKTFQDPANSIYVHSDHTGYTRDVQFQQVASTKAYFREMQAFAASNPGPATLLLTDSMRVNPPDCLSANAASTNAAAVKSAVKEAQSQVQKHVTLLNEQVMSNANYNRANSGTMDDLREMFKTNPVAVGQTLLKHPEQAKYACSLINRIQSQDETSDNINTAVVWGGAIVGPALALTGVGALAEGSAAIAYSILSSSAAIGIAGGTYSALSAYNSHQEYEALQSSFFAKNGDFKTKDEADQAYRNYEDAKLCAVVNYAFSAIDVGELFALPFAVKMVNRSKSLDNLAKLMKNPVTKRLVDKVGPTNAAKILKVTAASEGTEAELVAKITASTNASGTQAAAATSKVKKVDLGKSDAYAFSGVYTNTEQHLNNSNQGVAPRPNYEKALPPGTGGVSGADLTGKTVWVKYRPNDKPVEIDGTIIRQDADSFDVKGGNGVLYHIVTKFVLANGFYLKPELPKQQ